LSRATQTSRSVAAGTAAGTAHVETVVERNLIPLLFFKRKSKEPNRAEALTSSAAIAVAPAPSEAPTAAPHRTTRDADHHHAPIPHDAAPAPARRRRSRGGRKTNRVPETPSETSSPTSSPASKARLPKALAPHSAAFAALNVDEIGLDAIAALGYEEPTPIQSATLELLYDGHDVVGLAQTGTGKTIAFGLPLARSIDPDRNEVQAVVLVPTRELAKQVRDVIEHLGRFYGFTTLGLIGGGRVQSDLVALERGVQVVVGTPGRVIDHIKRGTLSLAAVHFAVLDEADQMLDIGFARDIDYILRVTPKSRQTSLFSATMPESIGRIVYRYMRNAERIAIAPEHHTADGVAQYYCEVSDREKFLALRHLYEREGLGRSLIFRRTKIGVDRLTAQLQSSGVPARAIHGDLRQGQRDKVMSDFRSGELEFLVATNVAARGLDIPDIENVINYDVPQNAEEYVHRIGRTARAGKTGRAYTFVGEWELDEWDRIADVVGCDNVSHIAMPTHWE
jgi:ATP-dependent RNA helicase DeaD